MQRAILNDYALESAANRVRWMPIVCVGEAS
jgi:hypothetical protein